MNNLREQLKVATERARSLKTKKAQTKAWDKVRDIERTILEGLWEAGRAYAPHSIKGIVKYFTPGADDFLMETKAYGSLWCSPTSDALSKSWYSHTCCIEYKKGQEIVIEIEMEIDQSGLRLNVVPSRVHGGMLNEAQYSALCKRDDLAFFKYPNGHMSGLFESKAGA